MAKRKTSFFPGGYFHIYNRGADRQNIFRETENYLFLLRRIRNMAKKFSITVIAYCLMPNHYHLLLRQNGADSAAEFMQSVFNSYSKAFNKSYNRTGTLFEGPFRSIHVDKEEYLVYLCRYIHRNPLTAGLVHDLHKWPYSNYLEWIGNRSGALVDRSFIRAYFPTPVQYQSFVLDHDHKPGLENYLFRQDQ